MLNKKIIQTVGLGKGQIAALALLDTFYNKYPNKVRAVFEKHEQNFTGDPSIDFLQTYNLAKDRGRYFTEDFDSALNEAKYFSLGNLWDEVKSGASHLLTNPALVGAASAAANAQAPGSGAAVAGGAAVLGNILGSSGAGSEVKPPEGVAFYWPPENEFPVNALNAVLTNPSATMKELTDARDKAAERSKEYQRQTEYHMGRGDLANGNITAQWKTKADEFLAKFNTRINGSNPKTQEELVSQIFSQGHNTDLDNRPGTNDLYDHMNQDKDKDKPDDDKKIMGLSPMTFYISLTVLLLAIAITAVILYNRHKKKKLAAAK